MARAPLKRQFGQIERLASGRYRARYSDPYGRVTEQGVQLRHNAPHTFATKADAEAWLVAGRCGCPRGRRARRWRSGLLGRDPQAVRPRTRSTDR